MAIPMLLPFDIATTLTVHAIDAEAGVIVLRDADGKLHVMQFAGTISNRPLTDAERDFPLTWEPHAA